MKLGCFELKGWNYQKQSCISRSLKTEVQHAKLFAKSKPKFAIIFSCHVFENMIVPYFWIEKVKN